DSTGASRADAAGEPRSVPIQRDDQRIVETAGAIRVGGVADVVLDALQLACKSCVLERGLELKLPAQVIFRRVAAPAIRFTLGDVAGDDPLAGQEAVRHALEKTLLHPLVGVGQTRDRIAPGRHPRPSLTQLIARRADLDVVEKVLFLGEIPLEQPRLFLTGE